MTMTEDAPVVDRSPAAEPAVEPATAVAVEPEPEVLRRTTGTPRTTILAGLGALIASLSVTSLLFTELTAMSGMLAFLCVAYVIFVGVYACLLSFDEDGPAIRDRIASVLVQSLAYLLFTALVFILVFTIVRGKEALVHPNLFTEDMTTATPLDPLEMGGILHAIVGTLIQISIALTITVPLGIAAAVYLSEIPGRMGRFVRTIVEAMTALPSIVAGLFIYSALIWTQLVPKSGLAAALAISVMMLPIVIRSADVVLRLVPGNLKEASYALGAGQWRTVWHVVLPTTRSGLTTAVILGTARGIGETSPVLLTAGYTLALNANPLNEPMVSLPLAVLNFVKSPQPTMIARGFAAGVTLLVLVMILFVIARLIGGKPAGQIGKRRAKRRAQASKRDFRRIEAQHRRAAAAADQFGADPAAVVAGTSDGAGR